MGATNDGDMHHHFLWLSDVHFDPHYGTPKAFASSFYADAGCSSEKSPQAGKYGCDSPPRLVHSALEHAQDITKDRPPAFVVVSGDSVRHGVDQLFTEGAFHEGGEAKASVAESAVDRAAHAPFHEEAMKAAGDILHELVSMVQSAFPESAIIVSVGNNDIVPDYYLKLEGEDEIPGSSPSTPGMLGVIYNALSGVANSTASEETIMTEEDQAWFLSGGFYARSLHGGALTVLSLNTVLYSSNFSPEPLNTADPAWQFVWMRQVLKDCRASGSQAIIVGHIPPAVGSFRHTQLWKERYIQTYYEIVQEFDDVIIGQCFGHLHSDEFRVGLANHSDTTEMLPTMNSPLLLAGSVTPLHGNDPSIRLVKYGLGGDAKYRLLDYENHKYDIGSRNHWSKLYTFSEAYGVASDTVKDEGLSSGKFTAILDSMEDFAGKESPVMKQYRSFMLSGADGDELKSSKGANVRCIARCRDEVICTLTSATRPGYDNCLLEREQSWSQNGRAIFGLVGAAVFVTMLVIFVVIRWKRKSKRDGYDSTPSVGDNVPHEPIDRADTNTGDQEMI